MADLTTYTVAVSAVISAPPRAPAHHVGGEIAAMPEIVRAG